MDDSKFVIIGVNGQLSKALQKKYPNARVIGSSEMDISDSAAVQAFDWSGFTTILNGGGYTNVDGAESDGRELAWEVNAEGVKNLTEAARAHDLVLVHISSDYVFDGTLENHTEDEGFSPLSTYGAGKAAGDLAASLAPKFYILRTTWVIGEGKNFVQTMLNLGEKGIAPTVVADQVGRLTFTDELVRAIDHLLTTQAAYGTYNVTNSGTPASWADITREIFTVAGYNLQVTDTTTVEYFSGKPGVASRPLNSVMDLAKLQATGFESHDWHEELKAYIAKEQTQ